MFVAAKHCGGVGEETKLQLGRQQAIRHLRVSCPGLISAPDFLRS
jgi:hypothetical protein